jgi:hypothetical protein
MRKIGEERRMKDRTTNDGFMVMMTMVVLEKRKWMERREKTKGNLHRQK